MTSLRRPLFCALLPLLLCFVPVLRAQNAPAPAAPASGAVSPAPAAPLPPVIARYEQMLAASPAKGTAFDKVYQHFFAGAGLDALAVRWQARAAATGEPNAESFLLLQGLLAERRARPDEARALYNKHNEAHPRDPRGWTALGELETAAGRFGPSADALTHAISSSAQPPVPTAARPALFRELARAQARNFLVAASLTTWRRLAGEFFDDPGILQEVGEAFQEAESFDEARATFERVRELARRNNDVFGRVNATLRTGQVEEARGHSKEAIAIYESVVAEAKAGSWLEREARARIESLYRGQEDLPGLAEYYKKSLADQPRNVETATRLAAALVELNRRGEAIDLLKQAVAWAPERQELAVELSRRLAEGNRPAEAAAVMEKLTTTAPEEKSYWQLLGDARWQQLEALPADAPAAEKTRLRAGALDAWNHLAPADAKPDPAATGHLADLLASHHLVDEALAQYVRAAAQAPDLPDTYERWATYLAQLGRKDEARKTVANIVAATPKNNTAGKYQRLAAALDRLDDPDGALDATAKGLALDARNFDLLALRWQLFTSRKKWDEAVTLYPALLAATPNVYFVEQVQVRHLTALQAAGKLNETRQALAERLGSEPPLDEGDLALLVRADFQGAASPSDDGQDERTAEARRALAEGRARFPKSPAFARLEGELAKRLHDAPGQVAALERLSELQPAQRTDALAEIARVWRDAGQDDKAIAAAERLVAASPANAGSHLLLADLLLAAGRNDDAVARLRDAVRLSDKSNEVRLRLTRIETDLGRISDARQTLDDAFEAAADAHERLGLMRQLTAAYQADNKLDELIARFQRLQQGEADGWHYALYLSELYQQTQDVAAARRELAKALAARPRDTALLRQLVRLATQENNSAETVRYQTLLTDAEPSDANKLELVVAQLDDALPTEALNTLRTNLAAILKVPGAWNTLLPLLARNDLTARASELLAAELGSGDKDVRSRFTLALFQAAAGNQDGAREAFWSVFDAKTPRARTSSPAPAPKSASASTLGRNERLARLFYGGSSTAEQRFNDASRVRYTVQAMLSPGGLNSMGSGRGLNMISLSPGSGSGAPTANAPDPVDTARDTALMYLAALAVRDNSADEFLAEVDRHLAARDSTRADRLVAWSLLDFVEPELREIAAQIKSPEEGLDAFCVSRLMYMASANHPRARRYSLLPPLTSAQAAATAPLLDPLLDRLLLTDPEAADERASLDLMRFYFFESVEQKDRAGQLRQRILAGLDEHTPPDRLETALDILLLGDFSAPDRAQIHTVCRALGAPRKGAAAGPASQLSYYPAQLSQEDSAAGKLPAAEFAAVMADLLSLWYPAASPPAGTAIPSGGPSYGTGRYGSNSFREENYLPASRFFQADLMSAFQAVPQMLSQADPERLKALLAELDRQAVELPPERRIYPRLAAIYIIAGSGDQPGALNRAKALQADSPDDPDLRLLTGVLLGRSGEHAMAVATLRAIDPARTGETPVNVQQLLLREAQAAKDTDTAKAAALRIVALRPTGDEREALVATLKELGLNEQAGQLERIVSGGAAARGSKAGSGRPASALDPQTVQQIQSLTQKKDDAGVMTLVRAVFAALPPPVGASNNSFRGMSQADYVVRSAVNALQRLKKWDEFVAEVEKARAKDPDSLALNYQLAILYGSGKEDATRPPQAFLGGLSGTVWLRLTRPERDPDKSSEDPQVARALGNPEVVGSVSTDGQTWREVGRAVVPLGLAPVAALTLGSEDRAAATIGQIDFRYDSSAHHNSWPAGTVLPGPWKPLRLEGGNDPADPPLSLAWKKDDRIGADAPWDNGIFTWEDAQSRFLAYAHDLGLLIYRDLFDMPEMTVQIPDADKLSPSMHLGIVWRADLSSDAPSVGIFINHGSADFAHRDAPDPAAAAWRKVVALRPKEPSYLQAFARYLTQHSGRAEAAGIVNRFIDLDPNAAFANSDELIDTFGPAALPDLVTRLITWDPFKGNNARSYYGNTFLPFARACEKAKRPDLLIALGHRAAELDRTGANGNSFLDAETRKLLLKALLDTGRRDEARDTLLACYLPLSDAETAAAARTTLGFRNRGYAQRSQGMQNVLSSISWGSDSVQLPGLDPLEAGTSAGLLPDLQNALTARQSANPEAFESDGLSWLQTLVRIKARDPAATTELPALLHELTTGQNSHGQTSSPETRSALALTLADWLLGWPGHEDLAAEALHAAGHGQEKIQGNLRPYIRLQEAKGEWLLGDNAAALGALQDYARLVSSGSSRNQSEFDRCLTLLARLGPDADAAYLEIYRKWMASNRRNNSGQEAQLTQEKNLRAGEGAPFQATAWLLDDGAADLPDATVVYELAPVAGTEALARNSPAPLTSRGRSFAASEGDRSLTIFYGPDAQHLAPLGKLPTTATFGTWKGPVPPGRGMLKAVIDIPRAKDAEALRAPDAPKNVDPAAGSITPILRAANLLANPGFSGLDTRSAGEKFSIEGWQDLPQGFWKTFTGDNPLPGRTFVRYSSVGAQREATVRGTRVSVEKGRSYVLSGWLRGSQERQPAGLGVHFLDAEGKELGTNYLPAVDSPAWTRTSRRYNSAAGGDSAMPPQTAFIEPLIRVNSSETDFTGLFLGKAD